MIRIALLLWLLFSFSLAHAQQASSSGIIPNSKGQLPSMASGAAPSTVWSPTAAVTIANTTEASVFSATGVGAPDGRTFGPVQYPGNYFQMHAAGAVTTPITGGSVTIKIKWGSTAILTLSSAALSVSLSNQPISIDAACVIQSVSATPNASTAVCSGTFSGGTATPAKFVNTTSVNIDTTITQTLDTTWTWGGSLTTQSVTFVEGLTEIKF